MDSTSQGLACVMMTLGDQDVSKLQTGPLSPLHVSTSLLYPDSEPILIQNICCKINCQMKL